MGLRRRSGTTAGDSSGAANPGTFGAAAAWTSAGHHSSAALLNGTGNRDRLIYLDSGGRLTFGTMPSGTPITIRSPLAYNDAAWHHVAATGGPAGLTLVADGVLVAADAATTTAASSAGYWRWGGGNPGATWPNLPTNTFFTGTLDEVTFYSAQLSTQQIQWHYHANH